MSRYTASLVCTWEGCNERDYFACDTRADQRQVHQRRENHRCSRHRKPDEVLMPDNPAREHVLVAQQRFWESKHDGMQPLGLFWAPEGQEKGGSGYTFGPGFKAWSKDFPVGTRLIVTARVQLPKSGQESQHD